MLEGEAMNTDIVKTEAVYYPVQCACGHLFLEKYQFPKPREDGAVGFCWCGFCRTRVDVYPHRRETP